MMEILTLPTKMKKEQKILKSLWNIS